MTIIKESNEHSTEFKENFGKRLRELRKSEGYTIKKVCEILNLSRSTYGSWELGHRTPQTKLLKDLCYLFNTHESYLLFSTDIKNISGKATELDNIEEETVTYKNVELSNEQKSLLIALLDKMVSLPVEN